MLPFKNHVKATGIIFFYPESIYTNMNQVITIIFTLSLQLSTCSLKLKGTDNSKALSCRSSFRAWCFWQVACCFGPPPWCCKLLALFWSGNGCAQQQQSCGYWRSSQLQAALPVPENRACQTKAAASPATGTGQEMMMLVFTIQWPAQQQPMRFCSLYAICIV